MIRACVFAVSVLSFSVICEALPKGCVLQVDSCDDRKVFVISETTKLPLSLHDVLRSHHLDIEDVPSNDSDCEKYFQQYKLSNPDSLVYTSSFWSPVARTGIEIEFCCLDDSLIRDFERKVRPFLQFVQNTNNVFFKIDIVDKYFNQWRSSLITFEEMARKCNWNAFYFKEVRHMLNSLLSLVDAEKQVVEWSF